jgi:hypothetical protein
MRFSRGGVGADYSGCCASSFLLEKRPDRICGRLPAARRNLRRKKLF